MAQPCGRGVYPRWRLRGATQDGGSFLKAKRAVEAKPPGVAGQIMAQLCGRGVYSRWHLRGATQDSGSYLKAKRAVEAKPPGVAGQIMAQLCGRGVICVGSRVQRGWISVIAGLPGCMRAHSAQGRRPPRTWAEAMRAAAAGAAAAAAAAPAVPAALAEVFLPGGGGRPTEVQIPPN